MLKGEKARSRSRSTSSTSSISRRPSTRSVYSSSDTEDVHPSNTLLIQPASLVSQRSTRASFGSGNSDDPLVATIKRENETLKKLVADLSQKRKCDLFLFIFGPCGNDRLLQLKIVSNTTFSSYGKGKRG